MVDLKFSDLPGVWQHFSVPIQQLSGDSFQDGFGFDGSSIRGFQQIQNSDMLVIPDPETAVMEPFTEVPTLSLICNVVDPVTRLPYSRDPRFIARKAEAYLKSTGIGEIAYFGPEAEFFVFDDVRFDQGRHFGFYHLDSSEGRWNSGRDEGPNLGYKIRYKEGYFPVPPTDSLQDLRTEIVLTLQGLGIDIEAQHHEVASAGQCEVDMRFSPLTQMGDRLMWFKHVIKNVARRRGKTATFMPKPLFEENGSGMHCHVSIWKAGQNLFSGNQYAGLSQMALHFAGGILRHAPALCAITNPTTNSYKRLVPGFEAPVNLAYSSRNRSAAIRIPMYSASPKSRRLEFRTPDPSCNGYMAFAAILLAGLDGIQREIEPGPPLDKDIYGLPPEELKKVPRAPGTLTEALDRLEADHDFLLAGEVFTPDLIEKWIDYKREAEALQVSIRPHPYEFALYFDI
jgi:glutamine synthetase